jgi:hypothetical protein
MTLFVILNVTDEQDDTFGSQTLSDIIETLCSYAAAGNI